MYKIILSSVVLASSLSAQWFVGVDYPISSNMNKKIESDSGSLDVDFEYKPLILKVGAGTPGDLNMNIYFSTAKIETDYGDSDNALNEFGYDIRKEFGIDSIRGLAPFIQGGISYGWMDKYIYDESAFNLGFKIGAGISYLLNDQFQFILGLDYKARVWQPVEIVNDNSYFNETETITSTDSGTRVYIGFNFWFGEDAGYQDQTHIEQQPRQYHQEEDSELIY